MWSPDRREHPERPVRPVASAAWLRTRRPGRARPVHGRCGGDHDGRPVGFAEDLVLYYRVLEQGYDCAFGTRFGQGGKVTTTRVSKLILNRVANAVIRVLFQHGYNDTTNAFKAYRRHVIDQLQPLLSNHFNLTVELPLKAIVRGYSYAVVPVSWTNRRHGVSKLNLQEMGSRYLFIVLYVWLEHHLSRGDYRRRDAPPDVRQTRPADRDHAAFESPRRARPASAESRGGRRSRRPVDEVQRPVEHLRVHTRKVAAKDADADELHAAEEEDGEQNPDAERRVDSSGQRRTKITNAAAALTLATNIPNQLATASGTSENAESASNASRASAGYEAPRPLRRAARRYSIGTWSYPTHATMPRRNRRRSGIARSASTTRRDMRRKSPACP